ncbi:hypothetical protein JMA_14800 [Jeotgalibacillus malaysiensis]|uniref:DUF4367 domain-containing protein n=1 Tax=Jeotgalibacillus malaysiensis TaxID=1508404 RepID=A0A0B5AQ68_9BACL|nr:hypothetical protein [Jeotgalibacillus malaysiensis]AJD90797.1 hypothetical protein JMA_14800 [Jeotgalibacillus malaysiensis]
MKKFTAFILVLILAAFMAACGTESAQDETNGSQQNESTEETSEETVEESGEDTETPDEETEEPAEEPAEEADDSSSIEEEPAEESTEEGSEEDTQDGNSEEGTEMRLLEQPMTLTIGGEKTERTAFLQESEENNYSMYVAEGFTFTPEEPNVDQVFYDEDGAQYMRVYTYPKAESEASLIEEQMKGQADAIQGESAAEWTPENSASEVISGYEATLSEEQFKTYLYETDNQYVRIAIYSKADSGLEDAFLQMADTIQ